MIWPIDNNTERWYYTWKKKSHHRLYITQKTCSQLTNTMIVFNNVGETTHVHLHTHVVCLTIKWERMTLWSCIVSLHTMYYTVHFIYILNRSHKNGHLIGQIMIESGWNGWLKVFHRNTSIDFGNNKNTYVCISVDIMIQWYWIFYNF